MKLSIMSRALVVLVVFVISLSCANTQVHGQPSPGLPQRRLLNFSGNTIGHRRLLNLSGNSIEPFEVPDSLLVSPGNKLHKVFRADGFQYYVFENKNWTLYNATANLRTFAGKDVGQHYFLPKRTALGGQATWMTFTPESFVTGVPSVRVTVCPNSIQWLLVNATDLAGSSTELGDVTYVQRILTENGLPPGTSYWANPGEIFKSPYTAVYYFYIKS